MLGDADQLPSVAAGSVLADLAQLPHPGYSASRADHLYQLTGHSVETSLFDPADHLTHLLKSHRFNAQSGIGLLAKGVINSDIKSVSRVLNSDKYHDIEQMSLDDQEQHQAWLNHLVDLYVRPVFQATSLQQAFNIMSQFRLLAAIRKSDRGVAALNDYIEQRLKKLAEIKGDLAAYHGKPIMITENSYANQLFNGDIGLMWQHQGRLMAAFEQAGETEPKWYSLARLPAYETVYAMTIHKTQGSEFNHVAIVLPETINPILSRELLYTGITRAKQKVMINSSANVLQFCIKNGVQRFSGLAKRIRNNLIA